MSKIGLLIISHNNYKLVNIWKNNYDYSKQTILNIDDGSTLKNIEEGKKICKKNNIYFLKAKINGLQNNINQACDFFLKKKINWILYQHHDSYPLTKNIFFKLRKYTNNPKLKEFGAIGFNIFDSSIGDLNFWNKNVPPLRTTGRSTLQLGDGWYRVRLGSRIKYKKKINAFAVESVAWSAVLINIQMFKRNIEVDSRFRFFHAWDDIAFQFLNKNIYNVVLSNIHFAHDQSIKLKYKIPYNSAVGDPKKRTYYWGHFNHLDNWKIKWGFEWNVTKNIVLFVKKYWFFYLPLKYLGINRWSFLETRGRSTFKKIQFKYKNTLLDKFYNHDPKRGYLKEFFL
jgi:hypothetical protein